MFDWCIFALTALMTFIDGNPFSAGGKENSTMIERKQVIIVGGGAAGLSALSELTSAGVDVLLLEAQDYLGGRIRTYRKGPLLLEDGAQWIHGGSKNLVYQIASANGQLRKKNKENQYDTKILRTDGQILNSSDGNILLEKFFEIMKSAEVGNTVLKDYHHTGFGHFYEDRLENAINGLLSPPPKNVLKAWMHLFEQVVKSYEGLPSWHCIAALDADNFINLGEDNFWKNGYDFLIKHFMEGVPKTAVQLNSPVENIKYDFSTQDGVLITTKDNRNFLADYVIVTPSIEYIRRNHHALFTPGLPTIMKDAFQYIKLGGPNKVFLHWDKPWWSGHLEIFILWTELNLPLKMKWLQGVVSIFSIDTVGGTLEFFVPDNYSSLMEDLNENEVRDHSMHLIRKLFKDIDVPEPSFMRRTKWQNNEYTLGSYASYVTVEGVSSGITSREVFRMPLKNNDKKQVLSWAGEHTDDSRYGTADGAAASGSREAKRILRILGKDSQKSN